MKTLREDTFFGRLLSWLAGAVCRRRPWFVWPQVVLFALSVFYTVTELQFDTSRNNLVGADKKYHQNFLRFKKEFPTQDDLVVVVESEDPEKNRQFIERLGAKIESARVRLSAPDGSGDTVETNLFNHIFYKGDLKLLGPKALLFVPEEELAQLRDQLRDYRPFLDEFARTTNLVSLFEMINRQFRAARPEADAQSERLARMIPALERIVTQATASLQRAGVPPSPGVFALFGDHEQAAQSIYLTFGGGRIWIATAQALTEELNGEAVERMRQLVSETRLEVPGLNVGLTGEPVLERDEMSQSQKDTALASVVALLLTALIFIYGYQETGRPLKATLCLVVGVGYTLGFATLTVGHLNLLTITFVPILIGLAIDFGVHLVTRYEEELRHGRTETEALRRAMVFTGQGIFTGAFTTAGAFLAMTLTDFKGIQEMGLICGAGLLICLLPMITLLPVLLLRGRQNVLDHQLGERLDARARIEQLWLRRPRLVLGLTVTCCALALLQCHKVHFDYNLLHMQSEGLPAVVFEEKLINAAASNPNGGATNGGGRSVLFAAVITDSLQQAVAVEERVRVLPSVGEVNSIARFLTENQEQKLRWIGEIKQTLATLRFAPVDPHPVDIPDLSRTLWSLNGYVGLAREEARSQAPDVAAQLDALHAAVERLRVALFAGKTREQAERAARLTAFQQALFADFRETFTALQQQDDRGRLRVEDLPPALRDRFIGVTGKFLVQVYPRKNVWERANQVEFIRELRQALDPHNTGTPVITGTPVQLLEYTTLLKRSYEEAALYALGAIAVLVFVHFRNLLAVALALCPVAVGSMWLGGLMGWFGIPFNPANIMTLPLVVGIGVTNGIHILNRFAEERSPGILARSTGKAVLVSGLTTIAGFGSLMLARHRGIESLGFVMAVGVATCMIAGLTFLPALLTWVRSGKKQPSADNARSTLGREEPR